MTDPRRALLAIAELATAAAAAWPTYEQTEALLGQPTMASTPASTGGGRSSDTPDPVLGIVLSHQRYSATAETIEYALHLMRDIQRTQAHVRKQHPAHAREHDATLKAARCDGSVVEDCTNNAVRAGLCWRCIKRQQRAGEVEQVAA